MLLIAGAGLCLGTFLHAQIVSRSLQSSVDAKAHVFVGSDASAQVIANGTVPEDFPYPATRVLQIGDGARLPSSRPLDLLAIDADTFADAAYWNSGFDDASLEEITRRLGAAGDGPLPVVLAAAGDLPVHEVLVGAATVPVEVVARPSAFPGLYSRNPLLVVDEDRLLERLDLPYNPLARYGAEFWARGDPEGLRRAFAAMETPPFVVRTAEEIKDIPHVAAAIDMFIVVNALGAIAAALTLVGMLMYLQARQRSQVVSYALSTRMGMRHGQHRRALTIELGVMLALAFARRRRAGLRRSQGHGSATRPDHDDPATAAVRPSDRAHPRRGDRDRGARVDRGGADEPMGAAGRPRGGDARCRVRRRWSCVRTS